ncbi:MAG: hypothetical protein ACE5HD_07580 [Acidobacteriota bacterium]
MIRRLVVLILALLVFRWFLRRSGKPGRRRRGAGPRVPSAGRMVRDRFCRIFLPEEQALRLTDHGTTLYFCSAACRDRFLASRAGRAHTV